MYRLIFLNGKMKGRRVAVQQGAIDIGRDPQCHLDLSDDDEVSRRHAVIEERPDGYYVRDLGSLNPVEVNGEAVTERKLNHGDKIEVGRTQLEFQLIVEQPVVTAKRRLSPLQFTAVLVIGCLLLAEVLFVVVFPMWNGAGDPIEVAATTNAPVRKKVKPPAPLPVPAVSNSPEVVHARALLNEVAVTYTNVPVEIFTSPVPVSATLPEPVVPTAPQPFPPVAIPAPVNDVRPITDTNRAEVVVAPPVKPEPPPAPVEDPVLTMAKAMMGDAARKIQAGELVQADQTYDRIQIMAPDFVSAYTERARLYEKRGMYRLAGEQWVQVLNRSAGTPIYALAAEARQRVARLEIADKEQKARDADKPKPTANTNQKSLRIVSVDRERFQSTKEYDEMRVLRINMRARATDPVDASAVRVQIVFYDRNTLDDKIVPTRAIAPDNALRVEGRWGPGETRAVTATYTVPRDFRAEEYRSIKQRRVYEGYRIRVFYKGELQDEDAMPKSLEDLPAPRPPLTRPSADEPVPR